MSCPFLLVAGDCWAVAGYSLVGRILLCPTLQGGFSLTEHNLIVLCLAAGASMSSLSMRPNCV